MSISRCFRKVSFVLALVAAVVPAMAQPTLAPRSSKVLRVHGNARVSTDAKTWQTLKKNSAIPAGSVIQTANDSSVEISLGGVAGAKTPNFLRMTSESVLRVEQLSGESGGVEDTELELLTGAITVHSGVVASGSRFEIKFADGIVGVRSGVFMMNTLGLVDVSEGKIVAAMYRDANAHVVTGGHHFDASTGQITDLSFKAVSDNKTVSEAPIVKPPAAPAAPVAPSRKF